MQQIKNSFWIGPVLSGILCFVAICQINFYVSWICFIPLFISIYNTSPIHTFKKGVVFGLVFSLGAFFWMIPGAERFTGASIFYGIGVFLISSVFIALFYAGLLFCFAKFEKAGVAPRIILVNSLLMASIFCAGEALLSIVSRGFPWFDIHAGNGLAANGYSIQPAAYFGIHLLTFFVVLVNYLAAVFIFKTAYQKLLIPVGLTILYQLSGYLTLKTFNKLPSALKPFKVAVLAENIPPEMKWDDKTGNVLVQRLLDLNKEAASLKPDMILWSESAIPWTYTKDDDLVKEVLTVTRPAQALHIMGINTAFKENEIYNSTYCILPDGTVTGRYDKQYLLTLIEKPVSGLLMPFFSSKGFIARSNAANADPLLTTFGKAGMLICNEAAIPAAASNMVKKGAQFLFNMSNDGWFNDTYIVRLHFYYARLRAVESRKDLAVNSNNGYSGMIKASGEIVEQERSDEPFVKLVTMQPNNIVSIASSYPNLFVYGCAIYILLTGGLIYTSAERRCKVLGPNSNNNY